MPERRTQRSRTRLILPDPLTSKLDDVRKKVRSYILNQTTIGEFHEALRRSSGNDEFTPHPLSGNRFRKIVSDVIRTRRSDAQKRRDTSERKKQP
jgi:hypothetical protein